MRKQFLFILFFLLSSISFHTTAQTSQDKIDEIIKLKEEPAGVVFEIITGKKDGLDWALPMVKKYITQIRTKFPKLDMAIVTHGTEQFALRKQKSESNKKVHTLTKQLVSEDIPLHVCGTHAEWRGVAEEDFPDYVDVSTTGPAQINDYVNVGYILVVIEGK